MEQLTGKISWFDALSGEGMVRADNGRLYYLHFTAIEGISKNNHHWPADDDRERLKTIRGLPCTFELWSDSTFIQVSKCSIEVPK